MSYLAILGDSQQLAIANLGEQTQINLKMSSPGQQQSQGSSFSTGKWLKEPKLFNTGQGFVLQIEGERGSHQILIQQNSISTINSPGDLHNYPQVDLKASADPVPASMQQQPMQPLKMGNMSMDLNSMSMQMGDMSIGSGNQQKTNITKQFCSQCGKEAKAGDRFCRSCGHELAQ